jgi:hypothetical protein
MGGTLTWVVRDPPLVSTVAAPWSAWPGTLVVGSGGRARCWVLRDRILAGRLGEEPQGLDVSPGWEACGVPPVL